MIGGQGPNRRRSSMRIRALGFVATSWLCHLILGVGQVTGFVYRSIGRVATSGGAGPSISANKGQQLLSTRAAASDGDFQRKVLEALSDLQSGVRTLEKKVASIDKQLGFIWESEGRKYAETLFWPQYTKGLLAQSVQDLCYYFPEDVLYSHDKFNGQCYKVPLELSMRAIRRLVDEQVPERLLRCISVKLKLQQGIEVSWFQDGKPDLNAVGRFIGSALKDDENKALAISLKRLKYTLESEDNERFEALQRCDGAGIMCVCAAAHPDVYLNESCTSCIVPPEVLQFDMRGRIDIPDTGEYVYVDVGEVKRTLDYNESIKQLGIRLGVLGWFVTTCVPGNNERVPDVRLVGRLFVREAGLPYGEEERTNQMQRYHARNSWGFSLYRHTF